MNNNQNQVQGAYTQNSGISPIPYVFVSQVDPNSNNLYGTAGIFPIGQQWLNQTDNTTWQLYSFSSPGGVLQANWEKVGGSVGQVSTLTGDDSIAISPVAGNINIDGIVVANATNSKAVYTKNSSGNTMAIDVQVGAAIASTNVAKVGLAAFNSAQFTADSNGFVSLVGGAGGAVTGNTVDAHTGPGTNPVVPNSSGNIIVTGGQVAAGTTANVIKTNSLAANTYTVQIQRSQAVGSSTVGDNGVSHFNSSQFSVDANGFVSLISGGLAQVKNQVFTYTGSSQTYTPTSGMIYCSIQILGGGGGGGGSASTSNMQHSSGSGGGGGEYATGIFSAASIGVSQTVTIGAGGGGNSGAAGSNGGNSSVGALITAFGGSGGLTQAATGIALFQQGGAGGTGGSGGDFRTPGQNGFWTVSNFPAGQNDGGPGGNSQYGAGGLIGNGADGSAGGGYGAGGGGTSNPQSASALTGGSGTAGIVIITEYIIT